MSKYNSKKVEYMGIQFDSRHEMEYYHLLCERLRLGEITDFSCQPKYILVDKFEKNGKKYQAITYTPDFKIEHLDGSIELIDVKGFGTQQGDLRRKLFDSRYSEKLTWVSKNIKRGDKNGWIDYDELKKARAKEKVK